MNTDNVQELTQELPTEPQTETESMSATATEIPVQDELAQLRAERDEFREISLRKVAELENFRRRTEQERQELIVHANFKLLQKLLPVLDDLQRAVESGKASLEKAGAEKSSESKALLDGVELVLNKTVQTFADVGVTPMEVINTEFDANLHEALMQMPSEAPEGQIVQEAQRGYLLGGKVLRHARVIVSSGMPSQAQE